MPLSIEDYKTPSNTYADAFDDAMADVPARNTAWYTDGTHGAHGETLVWPSGTLDIPRTLAIPRDKNVSVAGVGPNSTVLDFSGTAGDPMFDVGTGGTAYHVGGLYDLVIKGAHIEFGTASNRLFEIVRCVFYDIDTFAIKTAASSVVNKRIRNCDFVRTAGGVDLGNSACDLWTISECMFTRLTDTAVRCNGTGARMIWVDRCDFELMADANNDKPWVHCDEGEFVRVTSNRFGNETDATWGGGPPKYMIAIGDTAGNEQGTLGGYQITGNHFLGRLGGPSSDSAVHGIYLGKAIKESLVNGNQFKEHHGSLIQEAFHATNGARDNSWSGNVWDSNNHAAGPFSGTAKGFRRDDV